jgi:hypothetical protein
MRHKKDLMYGSIVGVVLAALLLVTGCKNNNSVQPVSNPSSTDKEAMLNIIGSDSTITSFQPNYDEESEPDIINNDDTTIYPIHVWQRLHLVNHNFDVTILGDSAFGTITNTFNGTLYIATSLDSSNGGGDTVLQKSFTSQSIRNVIFMRRMHWDSTGDTTFRGWRLAAVSLVNAGTQSQNISITQVSITLPNDSVYTITDPTQFYIRRGWGIGHWFWHRFCHEWPFLQFGDSVKVDVEIYSAYADTDFVTITHGANVFGHHPVKRLFKLISSTPSGGGYDKVYEQYFRPPHLLGFFSAVLNAVPRQTILDPNASVEENSWGLFYFASPFGHR